VERDLGEPFVVWIDRGADGEQLRGTVEHVAASHRERFDDAAALIRFLTRASGPAPP
jgi:hypothetical protein